MSEEKQEKYLSKQVKLGGHNVTLYSLNGLTWVSDPSGLTELMDRLENARVSFNDPKGAAGDKNKPKEKFKARGPRGARPTVQDGEDQEDENLDLEAIEVEAADVDDDVVEGKDIEEQAKPKKFSKPTLPEKNVPVSKEKKAAARPLTVVAGKGPKAAKPVAKVAKAKKAAASKAVKPKAASKKSSTKAKKGKK